MGGAEVVKKIAGKNVVLIGFMGTGKTEVGRRLADALNRRFIDSDQWIENKAGKEIHEIFAEYGEAYFRKIEAEAISSLCREKGLVLSTGGGSILDCANVEYLRESGFVIWLDADTDELGQRLAGDRKRPLLAGGADLRQIYQKRIPCYQTAAHVRVDTSNKSPLTISEEIMVILRQEL